MDSINHNNNVCTHLSLRFCCCTTNNDGSFTNKKRILGNEGTNNSGRKKNKKGGCNGVDRMSWGYSTDLMLYDDPWKIKKVLQKSDLGNMSRLLLSRELAENLVLPVLGVDNVDGDNGIQVRIWDLDTNSMHTLIFKKWATSKGYVFMDKWRKDFVFRRGLKEGDEIGLHWDPYNNHFQLLTSSC